MAAFATITIGLDPEFELGPVTVAWHGLMIAVGLLVGGAVAGRFARRQGMSVDPVMTLLVVLALSGIVGARFLFLLLETPEALLRPGDWLGSRGFAIYGAIIFAPLAAGLYLAREGLPARYLDVLAYGFPVGLAVGRIGDVINGEHTGPATDLPWGIRWTHPDALAPSTEFTYHSGGLYEMALGAVLAIVVVLVAARLGRPLSLLWTVVGLYGAGRFLMFFWRSDSAEAIGPIDISQLVSAALVATALAGFIWSRRRFEPSRPAEATHLRPAV